MGSIYSNKLRICGGNVEDVVKELGENLCFENLLNVPEGSLNEQMNWMCKNWDTYSPSLNEDECWVEEWRKWDSKQKEEFWEANDDFETTYHGIRIYSRKTDLANQQFELFEICFGTEHSPPYRAVELLHLECDLLESYLAFEAMGYGECGRWVRSYGKGTGGMVDYVKYTDKGKVVDTDEIEKDDWELIEEIWKEIHGEDVVKERSEETGFDWDWIPFEKRFKE